MELAVNPTTGEAVQFVDGAWKPVPTAINPQTKETLIYDGRQWSPLPGATPPPSSDSALQGAYAEEGRQALAASGVRPAGLPGEIVERGSILPFGVDAEGKVSLALPEFLAGPRQTIMDLLEGRRTIKEVSGKEIFELGALFAGGGGATGTGTGIARAAAERQAAQLAERTAAAATPAPVAQTARLATELAAEAPAVAATAAPVAAAAAPAEAAAVRGGLHSTPETLAMRAAAKETIKVLDDSTVVVNPIATGNLTREIFTEAARAGLNETITPMASAAVKQIRSLENEAITLQTLDVMRKVASAAAGSAKAADRNIAEMVMTRLDNFVENLTAKDLAAGTAAEAEAVAKALPAFRKTWTEMSKLETIARLIQRAQDTVANRPTLGLENTLRTEFTQLVKNDRIMRTFTPEERAAVRQITRGATKTTMRGIARLAPTSNISSLPTLAATTAIGAKVGLDPLSSAIVFGPPIAGVTFAARKLAAVLTQRSIKNLEAVVKSGGSPMAERGIAQGRTLFEQLAGQINTAMQAQAIQPQDQRRR